MSIRASLQKVLHVAPPIGMQHATNLPDHATGNATPGATTCGIANNGVGINATQHATITQQPVKTDANISATLPELQREARTEWRRQKVIAMLDSAPGTQRAIFTDTDSDPHNVILTIAVRACQQTCEMLIPKSKYDPWRLLELIERQGQATH